MTYSRYFAEALGTFALTFVVLLSTVFAMPYSTPVMAAGTLGLFVYLIGGLSGAHLNPAITIGLLSVNKMRVSDAFFYVIAQFIGAIIALILLYLLTGESTGIGFENDLLVAAFEAMGTFVLAFGISSVVLGKIHPAASGLAIGGSLFIGIYLASVVSNAVLNPAVALGIGSFGPMYVLGPIVGSVAGFWASHLLWGVKVDFSKEVTRA
jgi:aquaporin Z